MVTLAFWQVLLRDPLLCVPKIGFKLLKLKKSFSGKFPLRFNHIGLFARWFTFEVLSSSAFSKTALICIERSRQILILACLIFFSVVLA